MPNHPLRIVIFLTIALAQAGICRGDIYRLVDDDGVVTFTDSPVDRRYELVMKDRRKEGTAKAGRKVPRHLSGLGLSDAPLNAEDGMPSTGSNELPVLGRITSLTGLRHDPFDGKLRHHNGIDIAVPAGTPIKPVAAGVVAFSGVRTGYGNLVVIDHQDGTLTLYAHNSSNLVTVGDRVERSSVIALTGSTGRSTGPHLHFEAWKDGSNVTGTYVPASAAASGTQVAVESPVQRILQPDGTILFTNLR
jgi:murein DD-endopeptidase MepM/ murein hydrolase activator NlpD